MGHVKSESMPLLTSKYFIFARRQSTTKRTPSIVTDVSAMLVAIITFRHPLGAGSKALMILR
jgi:hypothetical protein